MESAQTECAVPIEFAPKKHGTLRFCVDHRKLNAVTKNDFYAIPPRETFIASLEKSTLFPRLDANRGYWHFEINAPGRERRLSLCIRDIIVSYYASRTKQRYRYLSTHNDCQIIGSKRQFILVYLHNVVIF